VLKGIKRNAIRKDLFSFLIPWIAIMYLAMAVSLWESAWVRDSQVTLSALFITGIILIAIGLTIALVAVFTLRRSYSSSLVIREDHQLIRHGIYRYVRHPVYSGTCVALFGMPLCLSSLFGLGIMLLVIPLFLNRIKIEEALLIEEFGAEYESYRETTRKLIPFVY
jgi:protein-S-isoprenylcysteine O-methyltransferase Ste14